MRDGRKPAAFGVELRTDLETSFDRCLPCCFGCIALAVFLCRKAMLGAPLTNRLTELALQFVKVVRSMVQCACCTDFERYLMVDHH